MESHYGFRTRKIIKLMVFSVFFLILIILLSGIFEKSKNPKALYLYIDYTDAMKLEKNDLNFYTDSLMKAHSLEEMHLFISGREVVSPLKGELSFNPVRFKPFKAASKIAEMKANADRGNGISFYLSFRDLDSYITGVDGVSTERFLKTLIILKASTSIEIFVLKDTLCTVSFEDKNGITVKAESVLLKKGLNVIDAGKNDYYSVRVGKEYVLNHNTKSMKIKVSHKEENDFLKSALKALGYDRGDGVSIGDNGNIKFSAGRGYGEKKKSFLISMTASARDALGDTVKGFYSSGLSEIPGKVVIKTSNNEPLLSEENGVYYFAVPLDTFRSNLPLIPEFIPLIDMLIKSSFGVETESNYFGNSFENSKQPVMLSPPIEKDENVGRKNHILPTIAAILLTLFVLI